LREKVCVRERERERVRPHYSSLQDKATVDIHVSNSKL